MFDSRAGALISERTRVPEAGFYPFWSAFLVGFGALIILTTTLRAPSAGKAPFRGREGATAVLKLILPMLVAVTLMLWLGFYIVTALYLGYFMRTIGNYRWHWVIGTALATPVVLYLTFERFFRVPLEKSDFYVLGILPF